MSEPLYSNELVCDNKWIQLRKIVCESEDVKGYVFSHEKRCGGAIVLVLPYKKVGDSVMVAQRVEVTPCWSMLPEASGLTGGVEPHDDSCQFSTTAVQELKEEAGYEVDANSLMWLGRCRASKSSDTWYYLWAADVTGKDQGEALGDGTKQDVEGTIEWVWLEHATNQDAQFETACRRLSQELKNLEA